MIELDVSRVLDQAAARQCEQNIARLRATLQLLGAATGDGLLAAAAAAEQESELRSGAVFQRARRGVCRSEFARVPDPAQTLGLLGRLLTSPTPPAPEEGLRLGEHGRQLADGNAYRELLEAVLAARALAYRAASPATRDEDRIALLAFLDAVDASGLRAPGTALRVVTAAAGPDTAEHADRGRTVETPHGRAVVVIGRRVRRYPAGEQVANTCELVELSRDGQFSDLPGFEILKRSNAIPWTPAGGIAEFCRTVRDRGPAPWRADRIPQLMQTDRLTEPEARILLSGLAPASTGSETETGPKRLRDKPTVAQLALLGMTEQHVRAAGRRFEEIPHDWQRARLVAKLLPNRFEELWEPAEAEG
ncbi:MAG TPA: hypothetical protein VGX23_20865 [Actinocrinis sp.]|nr:hypothetical protein [Actinocrinis sp.]